MARYAMVIVVKAPDIHAAHTEVRATLETYLPALVEPEAPEVEPVYVGDPCPIGPADEYETEQIRLRADGEIAYTAPLPEAGGMSTTDGLGA